MVCRLGGIPQAEMCRRVNEDVIIGVGEGLGQHSNAHIAGGEVEHFFCPKIGACLSFQFVIQGVFTVPAAGGGGGEAVAQQGFLGGA